MNSIINKFINRETISYLIVGILTTIVDYVVFAICNVTFQKNGMNLQTAVTIATVVSWSAAVIFAYITNKLFVFRNFNFSLAWLSREFTSFVAARLMSGVISVVLMWILPSMCGVNEYIAKIATSVFNVVFNYVASKLFIFKK